MTDDDSEDPNSVEISYNRETDERPPSVAIIEAISALQGVEPSELDFNLFESIDPDALDAIFVKKVEDNISAQFRVGDHFVTIGSDGSISVQDPKNFED